MSSSSAGSGSTQALNNWDLQRLLLVEMGYLPADSASDDMLSPAGHGGIYSLNPEAAAPPFDSGTDSSFPPTTNTFTPLSNTSNLIR
ncbi:hypothetical protein CVT25_006775 [Psilocybe cyanescens]|uniref:Uncharacterized protein n=1 Tax=Psilocybe cyanescens TaxID=93625 RepID=A0A409X7D9_PSICY|nr:hypothetical protein CVT25_006775 [Psilocybe cyanescens]